jgi:hypothetical protein
MKRSILSMFLVLLSVSYSLGQGAKPVNIAIITDKTDSLAQSPLISLLETQLSQSENIKLLERTQIDKIMQEQQFSAAGLLDRNNAIKIGQLLRADAFIIITSEVELIRVRVAEAAHGLRLLDRFEELDNSKLDEIAGKITSDIKNVIGKLSLPAGQLIPVGIVDIHRVQLGEQHRILERTLPVLLSVRLALEPKIVMLEREDLKILQDEKLRTQGEDSKFWASAVLIEGNLQPKNGGLEMSLSLRRPAGEKAKSFTVPVDPNEPSAAIDKAGVDIVKEILNAPPSSQWDLAAEAEQFYQQGQLLANHSRYEDAIRLFETAHTLQPQNVYYTGAVFERIWDIRREIERVKLNNEVRIINAQEKQKNNPRVTYSPPRLDEPGTCSYSDIELAELIGYFIRQIRYEYAKKHLSASDIISRYATNIGTNDQRVGIAYFLSSVSVATEQIKLINRENRRIWTETINQTVEQRLINRELTQNSAATINSRLAWISSDDPDELIVNIKKAFTELIMPPTLGGKIQSNSIRETICRTLFNLNSTLPLPISISIPSHSMLERTHLRGSSDRFIKLWQEYLEELMNVNDAVLSTIAKLAITKVSIGSLNQTERMQARSDGLKTIEELVDKLTNPNETFDNITKQQLIISIKGLLDSFPPIVNNTQSRSIWEKVCNYFIEQRDIEGLLEIGTFNPMLSRSEEFMQWHYQILDRIAKVLENRRDDRRVSGAINQIKDAQTELKRQYPQLDIPESTSSLTVTMLLTLKDWMLQVEYEEFLPYLRPVVTKDNMLWVTAASRGRSASRFINIGFAGINLKQKKLTSLWQARIYSSNSAPAITSLSVSNKASYISLPNAGIVEFPGDLTEGRDYLIPKVYTQENDLPSLLITSLAQDGDKLWVAYGETGQESGLGLYDPKTKKWETVFCSTLKGDSPFSQGQPYLIESMLLESPDKLLFSARGNNFTQAGLWKLNTDTLELKYIWSGVADIYKDFGNNIWFNYPTYKMKFAPDLEKITVLIQPGRSQNYPYIIKNLSGLDKDLFVPESFMNAATFGRYSAQGNIDLSTSAIYNNKLWARMGKSQIIIAEKGKSFEEAQIIDNNILDGGPVSRFVSTPYGLIAIGEGTVGLIESEK